MDNHRSAFFGISAKDEELDLPSLYWMLRQYRRGICVKLSYFALRINVVSLFMYFPHNIQKIIMCTKADLIELIAWNHKAWFYSVDIGIIRVSFSTNHKGSHFTVISYLPCLYTLFSGQNCTFPSNWHNKDFKWTIWVHALGFWNFSETTFNTVGYTYECIKNTMNKNC
jgi:hypothetical protein